MGNCFSFKGNNYGKGTVVKIYEKHIEKFKFYSNLIFETYNREDNACYFRSLYNAWDCFNIPADCLDEYIESIVVVYDIAQTSQSLKMEPKYIEGIVSAWIWYILIMFFGLFLKTSIITIIIWVLASVVFFNWRRKKINGE